MPHEGMIPGLEVGRGYYDQRTARAPLTDEQKATLRANLVETAAYPVRDREPVRVFRFRDTPEVRKVLGIPAEPGT